MKEATVILKRTKLVEDNDIIEYASIPEPNDPNGSYFSLDHKSSDYMVDTDSDWRLKSTQAFMLIFFTTITSKLIGRSYTPQNKIDKSKTMNFKKSKYYTSYFICCAKIYKLLIHSK